MDFNVLIFSVSNFTVDFLVYMVSLVLPPELAGEDCFGYFPHSPGTYTGVLITPR